MSFKPINVACLGMGWWSDVLADAMMRSNKIIIKSCYSRSEDKRNAFAKKYNPESTKTNSSPLFTGDAVWVVSISFHKISSTNPDFPIRISWDECTDCLLCTATNDFSSSDSVTLEINLFIALASNSRSP